MAKVKRGLPPLSVPGIRRTARTQLAALGVEPHVAERCLNHKLKGGEGVYNRHDDFEERRRRWRRKDSCCGSWSAGTQLRKP